MPTVACQPSLEWTQAVGAILMHQFARERFMEAGLGRELIQEAGTQENLDEIVSVLINDCDHNSHHETTTHSQVSRLMDASSTSDDSFSSLNPTDVSEDDRSQSMNSTNDRTIYHSMNKSPQPQDSTSKLEELIKDPKWKHMGRQLKQIAEEFERDPKRRTVRENANKVQLADITKENFMKLLEELFQDAITREKIVVLFFFCTDVALRAVSFAKELVVKLMGWSFSYLINTVCKIVHELGGWDNLLFRQLPSLMITCCAALGVCAFALFIRKSLKNPTSD